MTMPPPPVAADTLTTIEACAELGVSRARLRDLEAAGMLSRLGKLNTGGAVSVVYTREAVEDARRRQEEARRAKVVATVQPSRMVEELVVPDGMMTAAEVCAEMSIMPSTLRGWQRDGRLRPSARPVVNGSQHRLFLRSDVESLQGARDGFSPFHRIAAVADAIRSGYPLGEALDVCGVSRTTWNYWARTRGDAAEVAAIAEPAKRRPHPVAYHVGKAGYVYFISGNGKRDAIKIGWTQGAVEDRVAALQTGSPVPLVPLAAVRAVYAFERWCHRELADDRVYGEWFARSARLMAFIRRLRELGDVTSLTPTELRAMLASPALSLFGGNHGPTP